MRSVPTLLLALLVWLLPGAAARAQPGVGLGAVKVLADGISVRTWTVEQGLPQSSVTELVTDADGYLWGATFGGLFRFDGRAILTYSAAELPLLAANAVTALGARGGDLWLGTPGGTVARVRNGRFVDSLLPPPRDQGFATIDAILVDRPGEVWIREGTDVHRYSRGGWSPGYQYRASSGFARDASGAVLFIGPEGLVRITEKGASIVARPDSGKAQRALGLHVDRTGRVWMGTGTGLWAYERGVLRQVFRDSATVTAIVSDSTGDVWFAAGRRLLRHRPAVTAASMGGDTEVLLDAGATIVALAMLHDGLVSVGTLQGLLVVRSNPVRVLSSPRATPGGEVGSITARGDGTLFVTSGCGDVRRIDPAGRVYDSIPRPSPLGCSRSLMLDRAGHLWIGGDGAIRRVYVGGGTAQGTPRRDTVFEIRGFLATPPEVPSLLAVGDTVLFGLADGRVGRIDARDRISYLPGWTSPTDVPVQVLMQAADGAIWIAQTGMLSRWYRGTLDHYHRLHGIPNAVPRALLADARGGVWLGTYGGGLWYVQSGARARQVPLPDRTVSALLTDGSNRLWMPGNRGISVVPVSSLYRWLADSTETPGARLLSFAEGVPEGNNGRPAATRVTGTLMAFASVTGLVTVDATDVLTTGVTPPVRIDSLVSANGTRFATDSGPVSIMPDERILQVGFSAPSFRFAEAVRFRYRLDGRDDNWIALGSNRELRLAGLRPGRYVLRVEARVPGGEWRTALGSAFTVVPLFSEQRWPRVLAAILVLLLMALAAVQRVRATQATARAREIELRARRDAAESAEQHQREMAQVGRVAVAGELTASLSHELGQPLAAIVNNAEVARRLLARQAALAAVGAGGAAGEGTPPAVQGQVEQALLDVVAQGRRASQVIREFRRFLRREQGERERLTVRELIDSTTLLLRQEFEDSRVRLDVRVASDTPTLFVERVLLQQVLVNLLQNAYEVARQGTAGVVLVRARRVGQGVRISVADNGPGFSPDMRRSAFEPFVTTRASGMGMGLAIARRLVEAHGGHIAVGRLPRAGAVVSLWLPARPMPADGTDSLLPLQVTHG